MKEQKPTQKDFETAYNKMCTLYFAEDVRLTERVDYLERLLKRNGYDVQTLVQYIQAVGNKNYYSSFMNEVLNYLQHFIK